MLSHQIDRLNRKGQPAPLLDDTRYRWLWDLFEFLPAREGWCDACRNHPRHGTTVQALLQLAQALHTADEGDRRSSLEVARMLIDDALAGRPPKHHLQIAKEAVEARAAEIIAESRARRVLAGAEFEGRSNG